MVREMMEQEQAKKQVGVIAFLVTYQTILLCSLPVYFYFCRPSWGLIAMTVGIFFLAGLGITGGYHRYFSHRSYKARPVIESFFLFFGAMAAQGSALRWSFDHRLHHAHVDTDEDPYSIKKGFWHAHFLWLLDPPKPIEAKIVPDLLRNSRVMHQHRHIGLWMIGTNACAFFLCWALFRDFWGAFIISLWFRIFCLHHFTWFINSLAHTWGTRPFCQEQTAVNNYVLSFLTFGEGYHNYHHVYANDYRNGVRWFHFDPTKWLIWGLSLFGLATGLKRMDPYTIKKKMVLERKELLLTRLKKHWHVRKEELEAQVLEMSNQLLEQMKRFKFLKEKWREVKGARRDDPLLQQLQEEMKKLKVSIQKDWKKWRLLSKGILGLRAFY